MKAALEILRAAAPFARGGLAVRAAGAVALGALAGAAAGLVPSAVAAAVSALVGTGGGAPRRPGGVAGLLARLLEGEPAGLTIAAAALVTIASVLLTVSSARRASRLSAEATSALRIALLERVLAASPREVEALGQAIGAIGTADPRGAPPGKQAPAVRGLDAVKLAIARDAALVAEFLVAVAQNAPQALVALGVVAVDLTLGGFGGVALAALALFLLSRLASDRASGRVGAAMRAMQGSDTALFGAAGEWIGASEELRLLGARGQALAEFKDAARSAADARARFAGALAVSGQIRSLFVALSPLVVLGALLAAGRPPSAAEVARLLLVMPLLMSRLEAADALRTGLKERASLLEATARLLALPPHPPPPPEVRRILELSRVPEGDLVFEDVSFAPEGARAPLVEGFSLRVRPGERVVLCGASGSGKSTLLRLLLRLDDPTSGRITLGGVDLRDLDPSLLPRIFAVLGQGSRLLERSLRDNLTLGMPEGARPADEALRAELARVELAELAGGSGRSLETPVRHAPPNFSGGEQRRILLARALLRDARVLVLDEPEAGLPPATAEALLARAAEVLTGRTSIVVTHAPELAAADRIAVLAGGRLQAVGTHAELLASSEAYRALRARGATPGAAPPGFAR